MDASGHRAAGGDVGISAHVQGRAAACGLRLPDLLHQVCQLSQKLIGFLLSLGHAAGYGFVTGEDVHPLCHLVHGLPGTGPQSHECLILGFFLRSQVVVLVPEVRSQQLLQDFLGDFQIRTHPVNVVGVGRRILPGRLVIAPQAADGAGISAEVGIPQLLLGLLQPVELVLNGLRRLEPFLGRLQGFLSKFLRLLGLGQGFLRQGKVFPGLSDGVGIAGLDGLVQILPVLLHQFPGAVRLSGGLIVLGLSLLGALLGVLQLLLAVFFGVVVEDGVQFRLEFVQDLLLIGGLRQLLGVLPEKLRHSGIGGIHNAACRPQPEVSRRIHILHQQVALALVQVHIVARENQGSGLGGIGGDLEGLVLGTHVDRGMQFQAAQTQCVAGEGIRAAHGDVLDGQVGDAAGLHRLCQGHFNVPGFVVHLQSQIAGTPQVHAVVTVGGHPGVFSADLYGQGVVAGAHAAGARIHGHLGVFTLGMNVLLVLLILRQDAVHTVRSLQGNMLRRPDLSDVQCTAVFLQVDGAGLAFRVGSGAGHGIQVAHPVIPGDNLQGRRCTFAVGQEVVDIAAGGVGLAGDLPQVLQPDGSGELAAVGQKQSNLHQFQGAVQGFVPLAGLDADDALAGQAVTADSLIRRLSLVDFLRHADHLAGHHIPLLRDHALAFGANAAVGLQGDLVGGDIGVARVQGLGGDAGGDVFDGHVTPMGVDLAQEHIVVSDPDVIQIGLEPGHRFVSAVHRHADAALVGQVQFSLDFSDENLTAPGGYIHMGVVQGLSSGVCPVGQCFQICNLLS